MRVVLLTPAPGYAEPWAWAFDVEAAVLRAAGIEVTAMPWTALDARPDADLVLPLVAWGYNHDYPRWLALLDRAEAEGWPLANPPTLLRWNGDKAYLAELGARGLPVVETIAVERLDALALAAAAARLGHPETLVIKPPISGGADGTYRLPVDATIPADVAGKRMLVQRFEPTIRDGEWSLMLFGGVFSHAVLKVPAAGDFRVQPHVGGVDRAVEPPPGGITLAEAALAAAPAPALYARVDMIRDCDGALSLMELELIEPALFLHHAPDGGAAFASAVLAECARQ